MTNLWILFILWVIIVVIMSLPFLLEIGLFSKRKKKKDWYKLTKKERDYFRKNEDF
jgi:hypothetical protein